jgi:hypothetical protein
MPHQEGVFVMRSDYEAADGLAEIIVMSPSGGKMHMLHTDGATLACPEGDATIHVKKEEANDVFLCPKHSVPMEKVDYRKMMHKFELQAAPHEHHDHEDKN